MFLAALILAATLDQRVDALLAKMTLEEKIGQLMQYVPDSKNLPEALKKGGVSSVFGVPNAEKANELQRATLAGSRHKIPLLIGADVIHGYRTIFPIPLAMASSFDPELGRLAASVAATEAKMAGIRWTFAPMVDIARDPRWGRIAEGAGEDPHLGSVMADAYVRGFQSQGVLACAKHFAAYGAAGGGRDYAQTDMSEETLREVYLPPFHAAVKAGAASLMSSFNSLNGVPASANRHLLGDILRGEWKFDGFVVSDWAAVEQLIPHGVAANPKEAAIKAISAGVDMDMWDGAYLTLTAAQRPQIDRAVRRVLRAKFRAGVFDDPFTPEKPIVLNRDVARRIAQRSIVLLKNERVLPLSKTQSIAVVGPLAASKEDMLGPWSGEGKAEETVSVVEGFKAAGALLVDDPAAADVVIAVLGEKRDWSGEAASRTTLEIPPEQEKLLESLVASGKPVVLVILAGRPLAIAWAAEHVPAIVNAWFLGTEGGNAIADVLFGDVSPSAKMPVTTPRTVGQVPIHYDHLPTGRPPDPKDKFTSKYYDVPIGPLYPFGFGLTYTRFEYTDLRVSGMTVSATIRNAGERSGEEIVQLYINDPVASVSRPVRQLKGFQRVALLPGQSKRVEFKIAREDLQFWSATGWKVEPGEFNVWIAPDSASGLHGTIAVK